MYGDASGNQQQTTGASDYEMVREYFRSHSNMPVKYRVPQRESGGAGAGEAGEPAVASRRRATMGVLVDPKCKELIKDFEQVSYKAETTRSTKTGPARTHLSDALGYLVWQECQAAAERSESGQEGVALDA